MSVREQHIERDPKKRMDICRSCPNFWKLTCQCSKCKCLLFLKTKFPKAKCPDKPRRW